MSSLKGYVYTYIHRALIPSFPTENQGLTTSTNPASAACFVAHDDGRDGSGQVEIKPRKEVLGGLWGLGFRV